MKSHVSMLDKKEKFLIAELHGQKNFDQTIDAISKVLKETNLNMTPSLAKDVCNFVIESIRTY